MKRKHLLVSLLGTVVLGLLYYAGSNLNRKCSVEEEGTLLLKNVEALSGGEGGTRITTCLGLWGTCTLSDGSSSKAPLVSISK